MSADDEHSDSLLTQLDWKSQVILEAIYKLGGIATTSEIKSNTSIDTNDDIYYRYRRASEALEPHGLIEINEIPEPSQHNPPFEVTLTEHGERLAERLIERGGGPTNLSFEERFEKIEAALDRFEERLDTQLPASESAPDTDRVTSSVDARFEEIEQRLDHLEATLTGEYGAWSAETQQEHQVMVAGERAVRDFLLDEYGTPFKQYVNERLDEYLDTHENSDDSHR